MLDIQLSQHGQIQRSIIDVEPAAMLYFSTRPVVMGQVLYSHCSFRENPKFFLNFRPKKTCLKEIFD
jgi:hypothetical protein